MRVLIVEDEPVSARRLKNLLVDVVPQAIAMGPLDTVEDAVLWLKEHSHPDLMLLDIHLADGSSFEIFEHVEPLCPIIFTTAYDEYALKAFKVHALGYLLKPIQREALAAAVLRIRPPAIGYDGLIRSFQASPVPRYLRRMLIRIGQVFKLVDVNEVAYFFTQEKITFVVSRNVGKRLPVEYSLERLEQLLDPKQFFRINRQFIIHISAIREMHAYSKSRVKVVLDPPAHQDTIVSVERSAAFKRWLLEADT